MSFSSFQREFFALFDLFVSNEYVKKKLYKNAIRALFSFFGSILFFFLLFIVLTCFHDTSTRKTKNRFRQISKTYFRS